MQYQHNHVLWEEGIDIYESRKPVTDEIKNKLGRLLSCYPDHHLVQLSSREDFGQCFPLQYIHDIGVKYIASQPPRKPQSPQMSMAEYNARFKIPTWKALENQENSKNAKPVIDLITAAVPSKSSPNFYHYAAKLHQIGKLIYEVRDFELEVTPWKDSKLEMNEITKNYKKAKDTTSQIQSVIGTKNPEQTKNYLEKLERIAEIISQGRDFDIIEGELLYEYDENAPSGPYPGAVVPDWKAKKPKKKKNTDGEGLKLDAKVEKSVAGNVSDENNDHVKKTLARCLDLNEDVTGSVEENNNVVIKPLEADKKTAKPATKSTGESTDVEKRKDTSKTSTKSATDTSKTSTKSATDTSKTSTKSATDTSKTSTKSATDTSKTRTKSAKSLTVKAGKKGENNLEADSTAIATLQRKKRGRVSEEIKPAVAEPKATRSKRQKKQ